MDIVFIAVTALLLSVVFFVIFPVSIMKFHQPEQQSLTGAQIKEARQLLLSLAYTPMSGEVYAAWNRAIGLLKQPSEELWPDAYTHCESCGAIVENNGGFCKCQARELERAKTDRTSLLEALRPFAKYACDLSPGETCTCHNCIARSAIAKAEGRAEG